MPHEMQQGVNDSDSSGAQKFPVIEGIIEVHSLDADNCFLPHYTSGTANLTIAEHNSLFFRQQVDKHTHPERKLGRTIFMVGSARQGPLRDLWCSYDSKRYRATHSIVTAIAEFVEDFKKADLPETIKESIHLDKMLLDDCFYNREFNDTFIRSHQIFSEHWSPELKKTFIHLDKYADPGLLKNLKDIVPQVAMHIKRYTEEIMSKDQIQFEEHPGKFTLIYAQIHHIASQFDPKKPIHFHFYDDQRPILQDLIAVFSKHADLIPRNMTIHLHHYVNGSQKIDKSTDTVIMHTIQGRGVIDQQYRESVKELMQTIPIQQMFMPLLKQTSSAHFGDPLEMLFEIHHAKNDTPNYLMPSKETKATPKPAYAKFKAARDARLWDYLDEESLESTSVASNDSSLLSSSIAGAATAFDSAKSTVFSLFGSLRNFSFGSFTAQNDQSRDASCQQQPNGK